jgi:hypothetical protein
MTSGESIDKEFMQDASRVTLSAPTDSLDAAHALLLTVAEKSI